MSWDTSSNWDTGYRPSINREYQNLRCVDCHEVSSLDRIDQATIYEYGGSSEVTLIRDAFRVNNHGATYVCPYCESEINLEGWLIHTRAYPTTPPPPRIQWDEDLFVI